MTRELKTAEPHPTPMRPVVTLLGEDQSRDFVLPESGSLLVGRSERAEIQIDEPSVSREHLRIHVENSKLFVEDLGSANGTTVGGRKLAAHERTMVDLLASISVGDALIVLRHLRPGAAPRRLWSHPHFESRVEEVCRAKRNFALIFLSIEGAKSAIDLQEPLTALLSPSDLVASYGRDRFEILLDDGNRTRAEFIAQRIQQMLEGRGLRVRCAVVARPDDGLTADALISGGVARLVGGEPERELVTIDPTMLELRNVLKRIAPGNLSVLISGETGVGKEVVARELHRLSPRSEAPFVRIDCAAIGQKDSEEEVGARFRGLKGGTVLLDELGELSADVQGKLLRVVETMAKQLDFRVVSATNVDLITATDKGSFRRDLFFRLNGFSIVVPPLRERVTEIVPLATAFAKEICAQLGREPVVITPEAAHVLERYPWPGNVRELKNVIERGVLLADGGDITAEHLPIDKLLARWVVNPETEHADNPERAKIISVLESCGGNQSRAARLLGMSRGAFLNKLTRFGVPRPRNTSKKRSRET